MRSQPWSSSSFSRRFKYSSPGKDLLLNNGPFPRAVLRLCTHMQAKSPAAAKARTTFGVRKGSCALAPLPPRGASWRRDSAALLPDVNRTSSFRRWVPSLRGKRIHSSFQAFRDKRLRSVRSCRVQRRERIRLRSRIAQRNVIQCRENASGLFFSFFFFCPKL